MNRISLLRKWSNFNLVLMNPVRSFSSGWIWLIVRCCGIILVVCLVVYMGINRVVNDKDEKLIDTTYSLIGTAWIANASPEERDKHNAALIAKIEGDRALDAAQSSSREASKMQTRAFYVASLAALLSVVLLRDKNVGTKKNVGIIMLFFILAIYGLEVHLDDNFERSRAYFDNRGGAIDSLVNAHMSTPYWYIYKLEPFRGQVDSVSKRGIRLCRKVRAFLKPDMEQMVLYVFPWSVVYLWLIFFLKEKRRRHNAHV